MNLNSVAMYEEIRDKTELYKHHVACFQGMDCFFCDKRSTNEFFVLIFQAETRLKDLVASKEPLNWKQFRHSVSETAQIYANDGKPICFIYMLDKYSEGIPIQMIEGDRSKGRKYVFFMEEAITFLNGVNQIDTSEAALSDPVKVWEAILSKEHLTACMTEPYYKKNVVSYLDGNDFDSVGLGENSEKESKDCVIPEVKWIDSLDTRGFREFCFDGKNLEFGQINLLYGANGSGKTSVIEGIEYALTAGIRRMKDFKVKLPNGQYPKAKLITRTGNQALFYPEFSAKKSKEIEKTWYGVPFGRARSTLNANFSKFNEFDAEAAYKFIHETDSSEASFSTTFGNLMFGEEIVDYEKKWQRYKKAFDELSMEIRDELASARWAVQFYTEELQRINTENHSEEVERLLKNLKFLKSNMIPKGRAERYKKLVEQLNVAKKYVDDITKLWGIRGGNFESIRKYIDEYNCQEERLQLRKQENQKRLQNILEKLEQSKGILYQDEAQIRLQEKMICQYEAKKDEWIAVKRILEDTVSIELLQQVQLTLQKTEKKLDEIQKLERFPKIIKYLSSDVSVSISKDEIEQLVNKVEALRQKKLSLEQVYHEKKKQLNGEKDKIAEIKRLGKQLVHNQCCPLCGSQHSNVLELFTAIDSAGVADTALNEIATELTIVERELAEKNQIVEDVQEKTLVKNELERIIEGNSYLMQYNNDIKGLSSFVKSKKHLEIKLKEGFAQLDILKKQGITQQSVELAYKFKETDETYKEFIASEECFFDAYLDECIERCIDQKNNAIRKCEAINATNEELEHQVRGIRDVVNSIDNELLQNRREPVIEVQQALSMLEKFFEIPDKEELSQWITEFKLLSDLAETEKNAIANEGMIEFDKQVLSEAQEKVEQLTPQSERCLRAVMAFERMPSLTSFVENSIKNNIDVISQYFKWMHHSGEFVNLNVDQIGLYATRSVNNQTVRPYEMSTGQRSAIALSVMLALYSAAKAAPKFLLLDEPLATMDDIQIMNVLDILKTLAEQGTQIFFTTANDEMVRLFKEGFRGTSYTYREYFFTKRINGSSLIQERYLEDALPVEEFY